MALGFLAGVLATAIVVGVLLFLRRREQASAPVPMDDSVALESAIAELSETVLALAVRDRELTPGERLTIVDDLRARDVIDEDQHVAAREQVLGESTA